MTCDPKKSLEIFPEIAKSNISQLIDMYNVALFFVKNQTQIPKIILYIKLDFFWHRFEEFSFFLVRTPG